MAENMEHCKWKHFWILMTVFVALVRSAKVGDNCTIRRGGTVSGTCKLIANCPAVQQNLDNGIPPTNCGFSNKMAVVCCPQARRQQRPPVARGLISEAKCKEYAKINEGCQVSLIVGGKNAKVGEFPYMVALGWKLGDDIDYSCGGTLISELYVLTAAHCFTDKRKGRPELVSVGGHHIQEDDGTKISIKGFKIHPKYNPVLKTNDVALIELSEVVRFNKFMRPACLWKGGNLSDEQVIATGWGATATGGVQSNSLQKVNLNIVTNKECIDTFDNIKRTNICAQGLNGGDTCQGDSGGPLFAPYPDNNCMKYVVGVTSYGLNCGDSTPAVYARVSSFIPWIESVVWPN